MQLLDQLRVLESAQGDPGKLVLATVDLTYPAQPDVERDALKEALEAAAIPHWCDESMLSALLHLSRDEASTRLAKSEALTVVERFPARGAAALNVHEAARLALRKHLAEAA